MLFGFQRAQLRGAVWDQLFTVRVDVRCFAFTLQATDGHMHISYQEKFKIGVGVDSAPTNPEGGSVSVRLNFRWVYINNQ